MSRRGAIVAATIAFVAVACGTPGDQPSAAPSLDPATDKLGQVQARGTLVLSTDPAYAPQSFLVEGAARAAATKCAANQLTAAEVAGYDADTGKAVAAALGVEPCFVAPPWNEIIAGNWGDRWDVAWGSGALSAERMERLYVTQPYYTTPHGFFVRADSPYREPGDLDGLKIGACAGCTHELYLLHKLELPGTKVEYLVNDPVIVTFASEPPGLEALERGDVEAFLAGEPVGKEAIAAGAKLRMLEAPAYHTMKTGYADRGSGFAPNAFLDAVNRAIRALHLDGTLKVKSIEYFGVDYASPAATFDLVAVGQKVP